MTDKKKKWLWFCLVVLPLICSRSADAISKKNVIRILVKQNKLFHNNSVASTVFRSIGWGITKGLTVLADAVSGLYETCFGFIDFTKYSKVTEFMDAWKDVFIALMCLSILFMGILMVIGWEKKPQIVINLLIAVTVVTSGTYMIKTLNSWLSDDLRAGIIGSAGDVRGVYSTIGSNIHDLIYLDKKVGLENLNKKDNAKMVYEKFTQKQFNNLDINEVVEPDDVGDGAKDIVSNQLVSLVDKNSKTTYDYTEIYDGVAWTDLLNEYYYRYTVDWGVLWLELLSMIIVYLFMSYKPKSIEACRREVVNEIIREKENNLKINSIIRDSIVKQKREHPLAKDKELCSLFLKLYRDMPDCNRNMWNYNNPIMNPQKKQIDAISQKYIEKYHGAEYQEFLSLINAQAEKYKKAYGESSDRNYTEGKLNDLYTRMGNAVLTEIRAFDKQQDIKTAREWLNRVSQQGDGSNLNHKQMRVSQVRWGVNLTTTLSNLKKGLKSEWEKTQLEREHDQIVENAIE